MIIVVRIYTTHEKQEVSMDKEAIMRKAEAGEDLTEEEIKVYQSEVKPKEQKYGKYGTLAKQYIEEHNFAKLLSLAGDLPKYLHGVDDRAQDLYDTMYEQLSKKEEFKRTGDYMEDVKRVTEMQRIIDEAILTQIVYESD